MNKTKRKLFEMKLDSLDQGVQFISVVKSPAIDVNWHAFSEDHSSDFKFASEEKRMLAGPFMIPDMKIYRKSGDEEFDVYFSKETIELAVKKFAKQLRNLNLNEDHKDVPVPGFIMESWIITSENDKSKEFGFSSLPIGTWFGIVHIEDETYWNTKIKNGEVRGFSIEGIMSLENKTNQSMKKFAAVTTVDGVEVYTKSESEMIAIGDEVFVQVDGVEAPAPDGEHKLESGMTLVVSEGKVAEIKEVETDEEVDLEITPEEQTTVITEVMQILDPKFEEMSTIIADLAVRISALEAELVKANESREEMSKKVENFEKFAKAKPTVLKTTHKVELNKTEAPKTNKMNSHVTVEFMKNLAEKAKK